MSDSWDGKERRASAPRNGNGGGARWLMGIVAAMLAGILIGWYNDVRELRPDVAVLKTQVMQLNERVIETNARLHELTNAIKAMEQTRLDDLRRVRDERR